MSDKKNDIRILEQRLWRQYPSYPSTFNPCPSGCDSFARGNGLCCQCHEKQLSNIVGGYRAKKLHDSIKSHAKIFGELLSSVDRKDDNNLKISVETYVARSDEIRVIVGVRVTCLETGISASCATERSEHANKNKALKELERYLLNDSLRKEKECLL